MKLHNLVNNKTVALLTLLLALALAPSAWAAAFTSVQTGNLNAYTTWGASPSYTTKTGTITTLTSATSVTGVGTKFTTELNVGGVIYDTSGNSIGTIATITSDLVATLTANASVAVTGGAYKTATPGPSDTVTIASSHTVTLTAATTLGGVTINTGAILDEASYTLTDNGNFSNSGTFKNGSSAVPVLVFTNTATTASFTPGVNTIAVAAIGGGGSGAACGTGASGGGGGGCAYSAAVTVGALTTYTVTVGAGGVGAFGAVSYTHLTLPTIYSV